MMVGTSLSWTTLVFLVTVMVGPSTSGKEWKLRVRRLKSQRLPSTYTESMGSFSVSLALLSAAGLVLEVESEVPAAGVCAVAREERDNNGPTRTTAVCPAKVPSSLRIISNL